MYLISEVLKGVEVNGFSRVHMRSKDAKRHIYIDFLVEDGNLVIKSSTYTYQNNNKDNRLINIDKRVHYQSNTYAKDMPHELNVILAHLICYSFSENCIYEVETKEKSNPNSENALEYLYTIIMNMLKLNDEELSKIATDLDINLENMLIRKVEGNNIPLHLSLKPVEDVSKKMYFLSKRLEVIREFLKIKEPTNEDNFLMYLKLAYLSEVEEGLNYKRFLNK